jgi:hypothetical protein
MWQRGTPIEILRTNTDVGYDLVLEQDDLIRHVQLKSSHTEASTRSQNVNVRLQGKLGACVIWMIFDRRTLEFSEFLWFGNDDPSGPVPSLGDAIARHNKANAQGKKGLRENIRILYKSKFEKVATVAELSQKLFPNSNSHAQTDILQGMT